MLGTRGLFLLAMGMLTASGVMSKASTVNWDGQDWDSSFGSAAVNGSNLDITATTLSSSGTYYGDAHYNTDAGFRSASTPYIEATYSDTGVGAGFLAFEQESGVGKAWAEIGVDPTNGPGSDSHYSLYWWNETTNATNEIILAPRTNGDHTFEIGRQADGTVDFYLDNSLVLSTMAITPAYFGDVYLFSAANASGSVATFTSFTSGTNYAAAPLPASAMGGFVLMGGLLAANRLRRRVKA